VKRTWIGLAPKCDHDTRTVAPPVALSPAFRDQEPRISAGQIERLTNEVTRQIDPVNGIGELPRESHPHFYRQTSSNGGTHIREETPSCQSSGTSGARAMRL
jgi:hypothetical protein